MRVFQILKTNAAQGPEGLGGICVTEENVASRLLCGSTEPLEALNGWLSVGGQRTAFRDLCGREPRRREIRPGRKAAIEPGIFGIHIRGINAALDHAADVIKCVDVTIG